MASPIFVSKPDPSFSLMSIFKGCQFAVLGSYRLLQNQIFYENSNFFKFILSSLQLSILIQFFLSFPNFIIRIICYLLDIKDQETILDFSNFIQTDLLNIENLIILISYCFSINLFEEIFLNGLQYIDQVSVSRSINKKGLYSKYLLKLNKVDEDDIRSPNLIKWVLKFKKLSNHQRLFLTKLVESYLESIYINISLYLISKIPIFGHYLVSFYFVKNFNSKLGTTLTILMFSISLFIPGFVLVKIYSTFQVIQTSIKLLLDYTYFQRLRFSKNQINNWIESRIGLTIGFGLIFQFFIIQFSYIALYILIIEQLSLAFFIFKVTDPIPETITETWILTQIYWSKIYKKLKMTSDGFKPLPGSYMFTSHSPTPVMTPVQSSTELNEYFAK